MVGRREPLADECSYVRRSRRERRAPSTDEVVDAPLARPDAVRCIDARLDAHEHDRPSLDLHGCRIEIDERLDPVADEQREAVDRASDVDVKSVHCSIVLDAKENGSTTRVRKRRDGLHHRDNRISLFRRKLTLELGRGDLASTDENLDLSNRVDLKLNIGEAAPGRVEATPVK